MKTAIPSDVAAASLADDYEFWRGCYRAAFGPTPLCDLAGMFCTIGLAARTVRP